MPKKPEPLAKETRLQHGNKRTTASTILYGSSNVLLDKKSKEIKLLHLQKENVRKNR